jgi:hypothetical protein
MIPNLAIVHWHGQRGPNFRVWLPLFLLWIPAVVMAPLILPLLIIGCLVFKISFWRLIATFWALLCSLPGTDVQVAAEGSRVLVRIV